MEKQARHGHSVGAADASMSRANLLVFGRPSTPELARRPPTRMMGASRQALQAKDRARLAGFDATPSLLVDLRATAQGEYARKRAGEPQFAEGLQQHPSLAATGEDSLASSLRAGGALDAGDNSTGSLGIESTSFLGAGTLGSAGGNEMPTGAGAGAAQAGSQWNGSVYFRHGPQDELGQKQQQQQQQQKRDVEGLDLTVAGESRPSSLLHHQQLPPAGNRGSLG